jgi:Fic family protein
MTTNIFRAGEYKSQGDYQTFSPSSLNQSYHWTNNNIDALLELAAFSLGELNTYSKLVSDIDIFIHMHVIKEATTSSKIEGTVTTIDEAVLPIEEIAFEKREDWIEVQNYTEAMNYAILQLEKMPVCMRLIKDTHKILLQNARGENKNPGNTRNNQVWIGGSTPQSAVFIPPSANELVDLLSDLEKFIHNETLNIPVLIKAAIIHYQFETIHPFLDGNGRLGRLLITLYLMSKQLLVKPILYLSDYFERNRSQYYNSLNLVRTNSDIEQWIIFFLTGIVDTSRKSKNTLESIVTLKQDYESKVVILGKRAVVAKELLDILYSKPVVDYKFVQQKLGLTHPTVNKLLMDFQKIGILEEITGQERNRLFAFSDYIALFKK